MRVDCRLRELRDASLREVEDLTGINLARLSQFEAGRLLPRDSEIPALEQAYGASAAVWYPPDVLLAIQKDDP